MVIAVAVLAGRRRVALGQGLLALVGVDTLALDIDEALQATTLRASFADSAHGVVAALEVSALAPVGVAVQVLVEGVVFARTLVASVGRTVAVVVDVVRSALAQVARVAHPVLVVVGAVAAGILRGKALHDEVTGDVELEAGIVRRTIFIRFAGAAARVSVFEVEAQIVVPPAVIVVATGRARHGAVDLTFVVTRIEGVAVAVVAVLTQIQLAVPTPLSNVDLEYVVPEILDRVDHAGVVFAARIHFVRRAARNQHRDPPHEKRPRQRAPKRRTRVTRRAGLHLAPPVKGPGRAWGALWG